MLNWFKAACLVSLTLLLGSLTYLVLVTVSQIPGLVQQVSSDLSSISAAANDISVSVSSTSTQLNTSLQAINDDNIALKIVMRNVNQTLDDVDRPCGTPKPCGTIQDINKTLGTFRGTAGTLEIAGRHWDKNLGALDTQESQLFTQTSDVLSGLSTTETSANKVVNDFDSLITSPSLSDTLKNSSTIAYNLGQTTGDFQNKFHAFLYPPPCKGAKCFFIKSYSIIKAASDLAEPAYWGDQLLKGAKP